VEFNVLDLFSGIGGFSLGLERAGMRTVAMCEIDADCRRVLRRRWPKLPLFSDVKNLNLKELYAALQLYGLPKPNVVCGGFPCQDISAANVGGAGLRGGRSGLWAEFFRIISEIKPRYAIIENVPALRRRGLCRVLADLRSIRYDAEWHIISAADVGAPHLRERLWIVAYPAGVDREMLSIESHLGAENAMEGGQEARLYAGRISNPVFLDPTGRSLLEIPQRILLADGVPGEVGPFLRMYGNAVVPQIPEAIGRAIIEYETERGNYEN